MKKALLFTLFLFGLLVSQSKAQTVTPTYEYWGITSGNPKIFKTDSNGENLQYTYTLNTAVDGSGPHIAPFKASNGKLYGTCSQGGSSGHGTFFEYNIHTSEFKVLVAFNGENGAGPEGNIIEAENGKFYGMTTYGGTSFDTIPPNSYYRTDGWGTIFEYDPLTTTHTILFNFMSEDGNTPWGNLLQASDGLLYGTTTNTYYLGSRGTIFRFDPSTLQYTVLHNFDYATGDTPKSSLIQASNGKLYGTTESGGGGETTFGVLYEFDLSTSTYTVLYRFKRVGDIYPNGASPEADLVEGDGGKLYGVTGIGGEPRYTNDDGILFSYDINSQTFERLYSFPESGSPGKWPNTKLMKASNGKFYGCNHQMVYEYDPVADTVIGKSGGASNYCGLVEVETTDSSALDIDDKQVNFGIVYPNPTSDFVVVHLSEIENRPQMALYDLSGKLQMQRQINQTDTRIDMGKYSNGLYFLELRNQSGQVIQHFKIIKQ